jgi:quinol monooxygenase YgiN
MYGLIAKLTAAAGKRDQVIQIIGDSTTSMPGCISYVLAKDAADENVIWVTEVWDSKGSHDASLTLPRVKQSIVDARPLIAGFESVAVTAPVRGV